MKITNTKFKFIFALAALFLSAFLGGIFMLTPLDVNAATGDYNSKYPSFSKVGYYAEYIGTVDRQHPEVKSEGIANKFPKYGTTLYGTGNSDEKALLRQENNKLLSVGLTVGSSIVTGLTYDSMDKDGNLYLDGEKLEDRTLYKHEASLDMYYGNLSDSEEAVVKRISYQTREYGNHITGLYAPAGEVITLTMSKADFEACGGVTVYIGQSFSNGSANRIANTDAVNRMPFVLNTMNFTSDIKTLEYDEQNGTVTGYFGSFLGGPIYLKPVKAGSSFTVTISGGVRYSHFILGYTTEDEFKENAASSAPYFDLEVWDRGVRHSGPKEFAEGYTYAQLYSSALFWEEVASLSNQFPTNTNRGCGIDFLYDCFVTTQAVPQNTINCSDEWLTAALDYDTIVNSGCNELLNEYNLRFRTGWGLSDNSASNEAITLIAYSLFTDISSSRSDIDENEGFDSQNANTSASLSLRQLKGNRESNLAVYATLLHSFGQDTFINAVNRQNKYYSRSNDGWFRALVDVTGYDMTYYFTELCKIDISKAVLNEVAAKNLPMFVPAACVYQTGEVYENDGESVYFQTVQPYIIEYATAIEINFDECLELPFGFSYKIKCVTQPENGSFLKGGNSYTYIYTPDGAEELSGKIFIKIAIERDDKKFEVEDKVLILQFRQKQTKSRILERTVYTYSESVYTDATTAFESGYDGADSVKYSDNPVADSSEYGNADILPSDYAPNTVIEVKGKVFAPSSGYFRIGLRGRGSGALYLSFDGEEYSLAATLAGANNTQFSDNTATYKDIQFEKDWLYFKVVLLVKDEQSFLCLGMGKKEGDSATLKPVTGAYRSNYSLEFTESAFVGEHRYKDLNNTETVDNISGFTRISPDEILSGRTGWTVKQAQSTFGHIYEGGEKQSVEFTFYGTRFAIYSTFAESYGEFEIYVNNKLVKTVNLSSDEKTAALAYLSDSRTAGRYTVKISGKSGTFNIDSISLRLTNDLSTAPSLPDLTPDEGSENEDFRKPVDHPDLGDDNNGGNGSGQSTPNGGTDYTGLIIGLSIGGSALIATSIVCYLIFEKKRKK